MNKFVYAIVFLVNFLCKLSNSSVLNSTIGISETQISTRPEPCQQCTTQHIEHKTKPRNDTSGTLEHFSGKYYDEEGEELSDDEIKLFEELYPLEEGDFDDGVEDLLSPVDDNSAPLNQTLLRVKRAYVKMPTGKRFKIPSPTPKYKRDWSCRNIKSKKFQVKPYGQTAEEYKIIRKEMEKTKGHHPGYSFTHYKIIKMEKIYNGCLWKQYLHRQKEILADHSKVNQRMLWHGSKSVDDIVEHGFNEQYSNVHGMFGAGLYFAKHSSKSNQYVFNTAKASECPLHKDMNCKICERKQILCRVAMGRTKIVYTMQRFYHAPIGFHSVTALPSNRKKGLKYPEYIVYRKEQAYPEYLITYKIA